MTKKLSVIILTALIAAVAGCVKETYEIDKLSKEVHFSQGFGVSVVKGTFTLSDIIEKNDTILVEGDTVFIDDEYVVTFVFRKDSVISFNLDDYYDIDSLLSYEKSFEVGELNLGTFRDSVSFSLSEIINSSGFDPVVRNALVLLDGHTGYFPEFPSIDLDDKTYGPFDNFNYATFSAGVVEVAITNNLSIPVSGLIIQLYNEGDMTVIGAPMTFSTIAPGQTAIRSIDLENAYISNSIIVSTVLTGSGGVDDVSISLDNDNIKMRFEARDLKIRSGQVILPLQKILSFEEQDTISFDPGDSIKISEISISTGYLTYNINSGIPLQASLEITLPTSLRDNDTIIEIIEIEPDIPINDSIQLANSVIDLSTVAGHEYNRLPVEYAAEVSSDGEMIIFNSTDEVNISISMTDPGIDYVKGYFGQYGDTIEAETFDLEIEDILENVTYTFLISDPLVRLNYFNSFAVPVEINVDATGYRGDDVVDLDLDPERLDYPAAPGERDKEGVFIIDNTSNFEDLISMPPEQILFGGSAVMNPDGDTGSMDNYIFGNSRFLGNLEVEIPMEFSFDITLADTIDNPFLDEDFKDSPVAPEDIDSVRILLDIENTFPLGILFSASLWESVKDSTRSTITDKIILDPAPVNTQGKTDPIHYTTEISLTKEFWKYINTADKIIFTIKLVTTDNEEVKIYSDYYLNYKAALFVKPNINMRFSF
ncbi:MAG: hypothetical protein V1903_01880 [Bacteroidota bacterium]